MTLQEMINAALSGSSPGGASVTPEEGQDILSRGVMLGASAADLSAISGIPVDEINAYIQANNLQGSLANEGAPEDTYTPPATTAPPPVTTAPPPATTTPPPVTTPPPATAAPPPGTYQEPTPVLTPSEMGLDFFNSNPGALGFADLNPQVVNAESTVQAAVPEILKPFLADSVNYSQGALDSLGHILTQNNALVAPFNALQQEAQAQTVDVARGAGGYIQDAQDVFREVADGSDVTSLFERAQSLMEAPGVLDSLQAFGAESPISSSVTDHLTSIATDAPMLNGTAVNALESTASGDYLYGGDGFNAAVDASIRKAMPNIKSNMALQGGAGALSGGLADAAIAEVTADAFARQYGQERTNQLAAANQLNNFGLSGTSQRLGAAGLLGDLSLGGRSMQQSALNSALGGFQNAGYTYSNIANQERGRQIAAAGQLPQVGLLSAGLLDQVGNTQQQQDQMQRQGNVDAMQQLLQSSFGNVNPNALFGNIQSVQQNENTGLKALGGAMAGNSLAGSLGIGGPWGAIGGGLLGAFG